MFSIGLIAFSTIRIVSFSENGQLHQSELLEALRASMEENGMIFDSRELKDLTR